MAVVCFWSIQTSGYDFLFGFDTWLKEHNPFTHNPFTHADTDVTTDSSKDVVSDSATITAAKEDAVTESLFGMDKLFKTEQKDSLGLKTLGDFDRVNSPRIAWLLTYPKSGDLYIQNLIHITTNLTTANNYGMTVVDGSQVNSRQVWADRTQGPYRQNELEIPSEGYLLTKTHCGGWCFTCLPRAYWQPKFVFLKECLASYRHNQFTLEKVQYDGKLVGRAIHLIREPFSNIIARFLRYEERVNDVDFDPSAPTTPTGYSMSLKGFREFCQDLDSRLYREEFEWFLKYPEWSEAFAGVPCRSEFWKYFKWHNLARNAAADIQQLPYMLVNYFNLKDNLNTELDKMIKFLELPKVTTGTFNTKYNLYYYFYTVEQVAAVQKLCQYMCDEWLYLELSPFFEDAKNPDFRSNPNDLSDIAEEEDGEGYEFRKLQTYESE